MKPINTYTQLIALLFVIAAGVQAQDKPTKQGMIVLPSPRGNYLLVAPMKPTADDSVRMQETAYFQIERTELTNRDVERALAKIAKAGDVTKVPSDELIKTREIARLQRPNTVAEVRRLVSAEYLTGLKQSLNLATDEDLLRFLQTHTNPKSYGVAASTLDLHLLLGNVFIDPNVKAGTVYHYRVTRVDKANQRTPLSEGTTVAGARNPTLDRLKPRTFRVQGTDSLVMMTWTLPLSQFKPLLAAPQTNQNDITDPAVLQSLAIHFTFPEFTQAAVMVYTGTDWKQVAQLVPTLTPTGDSLVYYWQKPCVPEEVVRAYLEPLDLVENRGLPSDTITAVAVSNAQLRYIYSVSAKIITDGIRVSWPKLLPKPYYTGIEVSRRDGADTTFTVLAQLSPQDSLYEDYHTRPGVNYTYHLRPVFIPLQGLEQPVPAETIGTATKFSRPLPVSNLQVSNEGPNVRLTWDHNPTPSHYAYFVYRGTSKDNIALVRSDIREGQTYLDTADALSGRTTYYYSVLSMNLTQDTSTLAPPVAIRPLRPIETTYPKTVDVSVVNKAAWLSWNDVRQVDNILTGFVLQKRTQLNGPFSPLSATALTEPSFIDTTLRAGQTVLYRVAALTAFGDTTEFSEATELTIPLPAPEPVYAFYVRNTTAGIEVSWPNVAIREREKYGIYRREADQDEFARIGEVDQTSSLYLDKQVRPGVKYVYSVSAIEAGNRESKRVKSQAVIRR